jgi:dUTP pyrophosphatase
MNNMTKLAIEFIVTNPLLEELHGVPEHKTTGSGAMDLIACIDKEIILKPQEQIILDMGFKMHIKDPRFAGVVMPRSGMGSKGLVCGNTVGFIDSDYQGPLKCVVWNRWMPDIYYKEELLFKGGDDIVIKPGDRICQIAFMRVEQAKIVSVTSFDEATARGEGGFGSTGTGAPQSSMLKI